MAAAAGISSWLDLGACTSVVTVVLFLEQWQLNGSRTGSGLR
jgi:hypothetical protein